MDIRQLIEHAFQMLKLVTLYEMEQLIINIYALFKQDGQYDMSLQTYQQYFAN